MLTVLCLYLEEQTTVMKEVLRLIFLGHQVAISAAIGITKLVTMTSSGSVCVK